MATGLNKLFFTNDRERSTIVVLAKIGSNFDPMFHKVKGTDASESRELGKNFMLSLIETISSGTGKTPNTCSKRVDPFPSPP